jgi:hypothetical protein
MLGKVRGWIGKAIERWRLFWSLDAGHHFQALYHSCRFRRDGGEAHRYQRVFNLVVGPLRRIRKPIGWVETALSGFLDGRLGTRC